MTPDQDPSTKVSGAPASGPRTVIGVDGGVAVEQLVISSDDDPRRMTRFDLAPPRHFVFPAVLLLLSEEPSYGYELVKGLRDLSLRHRRPSRRVPRAGPAREGRLGGVVVGPVEGGDQRGACTG